MDLTINIKQGLGDIRFMMPVEEVVALIGNADEVENIDNAADEPTTVLRYNDHGITLFFEGENPILACDMTERQLVELMVKNKYLEQDVDEEDWGERRVSFPEGNIDFFFDDDELVSIIIGQ